MGRRASECARVHARERESEEERQNGRHRACDGEGHVWQTGQMRVKVLEIAGEGRSKSMGLSSTKKHRRVWLDAKSKTAQGTCE